jgi:hypothetical protein
MPFSESPLTDPVEYIYSCIDGSSSVDFISKKVFFAEYRVFESIADLLKAERIMPLSDKLSQSITAALQRKTNPRASHASEIALSIFATTITVFLLFLAGLIIRSSLLSKETTFLEKRLSECIQTHASQKFDIACTSYFAEYGEAPRTWQALIKSEYFFENEMRSIKPYIQSMLLNSRNMEKRNNF